MYIKLETGNSRLVAKHETSFISSRLEDNHLLLGRMPRKIEEIPVI
jgi:hypothetical protein